MRKKLLTGMILMVAMVSGCRIEGDYEPETLEFHRYGSGLPMAEVRITKDDEIYRYVKALLEEHEKGWHPSIVHYAPHVKVRAQNDMYRLNICPDKLVLMYWDKEKKHTTQLVKKVSNEPYNEIVVLVEAALRGTEAEGGSGENNS